jgi:sec-independent protein translocase protein TatA
MDQALFALFIGPIGLPEWIIIILLAVLIFGGRRLGELGRGLGEGIKNFRSAVKDEKPAAEGEKKTSA